MRNSNANAMIENQIARELDKLNSILTDEDEKPVILQRIAELKTMLDAPTVSPLKLDREPTTRELISELIAAFRRR